MKETRHLILNENCSPTCLEHTHVLQKMFNKLHAETFPLLSYSVSENEVRTSIKSECISNCEILTYILVKFIVALFLSIGKQLIIIIGPFGPNISLGCL